MQACRQRNATQRSLALESFANPPQHRHVLICPVDTFLAGGGQLQIFYVIMLDSHGYSPVAVKIRRRPNGAGALSRVNNAIDPRSRNLRPHMAGGSCARGPVYTAACAVATRAAGRAAAPKARRRASARSAFSHVKYGPS